MAVQGHHPESIMTVIDQVSDRLASMTVKAAILIMRLTDELDVRMCIGAFTPSRKGPTATLLPATVLSRL